MRIAILTAVGVLCTLTLSPRISAHCQIPCGIYDDMLRIKMLEEDVTTLEKSIRSLRELAGKTSAEDVNQAVRWVKNKEVHADRMSEVVVEYFLRQRIKEPKADDAAAQKKYTDQLVALHRLLVTTMKAKQTVDPEIPGRLREQIKHFRSLYFSEEDEAHAKHEHD